MERWFSVTAAYIYLAAGGWLGSLWLKGPPACFRHAFGCSQPDLRALQQGATNMPLRKLGKHLLKGLSIRSETCSQIGKGEGEQTDSEQVQIQDKLQILCCIIGCVSSAHEPRGTACFTSLSHEYSTDTRGSAPFPLGRRWRQELSRAKENKTMFA